MKLEKMLRHVNDVIGKRRALEGIDRRGYLDYSFNVSNCVGKNWLDAVITVYWIDKDMMYLYSDAHIRYRKQRRIRPGQVKSLEEMVIQDIMGKLIGHLKDYMDLVRGTFDGWSHEGGTPFDVRILTVNLNKR